MFFVILYSYYYVWFFVIVFSTFYFLRCFVAVSYFYIGNSDEQSIFDEIETINQIMVMNQNHIYYSHYTIIKFIEFESNYYVINLNVISSFIVFNEFVYLFISRCYFYSSITSLNE